MGKAREVARMLKTDQLQEVKKRPPLLLLYDLFFGEYVEAEEARKMAI